MASPQSTLPNDEKEAQDSAYNPGEQAYREGMGAGAHDSIPGYDRANDGLDAIDPDNDSAAAVKKAEENPDDASLAGGLYKPSENKKKKNTKQKFSLKKRGGIIGLIVALLGGGGIVGTILLSPSALFLDAGNTFTNAFNDSGPALSVRANLLLKLKINGLKNAFDQSSDGKCNIKCKLGTVSEAMKSNLESSSNEFHAEFGDRKFGGRYTIKQLTFPDGTVVTNGDEFDAAMKDPVKLRAFNREFNNPVKFFLNGSKFGTALKTKLGLDRLQKVVSGAKDKIIASLRTAVGATGDSSGKDGTGTVDSKRSIIANKISAKIKAPTAKAGKVSDAIGAVCLAYDTTQISIAATKAAKLAAFAGFAIAFLQVKDEIQAGTADGDVLSTLGAQLTEGNNQDTAAVYQQAKYGTNAVSTSKFTLNPSSGLTQVLAGIGGVIAVNAIARATAHTACASANNPAAPVFQCLPEIIAGLAELGVGAVVNAVGCVGINVVAGFLIGSAIGAALPLVIDAIVKGDLTIPDETTKGADAMQVIGLGTKPVFNGESQAVGLHPATSAEDIKNYNTATLGVVEENKTIAQLDAQSDPFDINNPDTFLGSFVNKLGLAGYKNASLLSAIRNTFGLIPRSFAAASSTIYADSGFPLGYDKSTLYSLNNSGSLGAIGAVSSNDGEETYIMTPEELNMGIYTAVDTLVAANNIDGDTGAAIPGSDYDKYTKYCGADRTDPMGETTASINDDDYEWEIGAKCTDTSPLMEAVHVYTMDSGNNDMYDKTNQTSPAAAAATTAISPLTTGAAITNLFTPTDPGVDLSGTAGAPVHAIMAGEVTAVGTDTAKTISIKHTNGSVSQYLNMKATVKVGDKVTLGQQIGTLGSGASLGLRIYIDGVDLTTQTSISNVANNATNIIKTGGHTYINPVPYLDLFGLHLLAASS